MVKCQFQKKEVINGEEVIYECDKEARGIIRCKDVCQFHFSKLRQDNLYRQNNGIDIPEDTSLLIKIKDIYLKVNRVLPKGLNTNETNN